VDLLLVRDDDIPELLSEGLCEAGIAGLNVIEEYRLSRPSTGYDIWRELDFGSCRLSLAVPEDSEIVAVSALAGSRVATSHPQLTRRYFAGLGLTVEIVCMNGAVELAPRLGKAEAICDLISTGSTLKANHLRELEPVFKAMPH